MKISELKELLTESDYEIITTLAAQGEGPRGIAHALQYELRPFLYLWRDKKSRLREAYEQGVIDVHIAKSRTLMDLAILGNVTAIQIHEKITGKQRFEDIKREIFSIS
ncbi:MAG: hypothetical protein AB3N16_02625 [Flavobacteriaceae bacterium]